MNDKTLSNLTFSFNESRRSTEYQNTVNTFSKQRTKKLISDDNNLNDLFKKARSNSNTSYESEEQIDEGDFKVVEKEDENLGFHRLDVHDNDSPWFQNVTTDKNVLMKSNSNNNIPLLGNETIHNIGNYESNARGVDRGSHGNNVKKVQFDMTATKYSENHVHEWKSGVVLNDGKKYEWKSGVVLNDGKKYEWKSNALLGDERLSQSLSNETFKSKDRDLPSNAINEDTDEFDWKSSEVLNNDKKYTFKSKMMTMNNNGVLPTPGESPWVPKSKTARGILSNQQQDRLSQTKSKTYQQHSYENDVNSGNFLINGMPAESNLQSANCNEAKEGCPNQTSHSIKKKNDDLLTSSPTVFHRKLTVSMNKPTREDNSEFSNRDGAGHSTCVATVADDLMSYDALKKEKSLKYKQELSKRRNGSINNLNAKSSLTHNVTDFGNFREEYSVMKNELTKNDWSKKSIEHSNQRSSDIDNKFKNLNFVKNRSISNTNINKYRVDTERNVDGKLIKQIRHQNLSQNMYAVGNEEPVGKDFAYSKMIKRANIDGFGLSFDDGYSSGSNRTGYSEISTPSSSHAESSFIASLTEELNHGSNDLARETVESKYDSSKRQQPVIKDVSNYEASKEDTFNKEETLRRQSIHSKLEDIFKQKIANQNPKKTTYKFEDPILQEETTDMKKADASFANNDQHDAGAPRILRERRPDVLNDDIYSQQKRTLIKELSRTISRKHSFTAPDFVVDQQDGGDQNCFIEDQNEDDFPPPPNLYDMFPLPMEADSKHKNGLDEGIQQNDEQPINVNAVASMLQSHLKEKQKETKTKVYQKQNADRKFVFMSTDLMERDTTKKSYQYQEHPSGLVFDPIDELEQKQKRLSLEYERNDFSPLTNSNNAKTLVKIEKKVFDPETFSLSETDLIDAKRDLPFIQPDAVYYKGGGEEPPATFERQVSTTSTQETFVPDEIKKAWGNQVTTPRTSTGVIRTRSYTSKKSQKPSEKSYNESLLVISHTTDSSSVDAIKQDEIDVEKTRPQLHKHESKTDVYLPEDNDEQLIRPSEFRIHKFKGNSNYRYPSSPPAIAPLKINASKITDTSARQIKRVEKRHATDNIQTTTIRTRSASQLQLSTKRIITEEDMETESIDKIGSNIMSKSREPAYNITQGRSVNAERKYAWENTPYVPLGVGKVNIPTSFQDQTGSHQLEKSPRPSTAKKTRLHDHGNRSLSSQSQPATPTRLGGRLKQMFSPNMNANRKPRSLSLDITTVNGLTQHRNLSTSAWGFSDDDTSMNGGSIAGSENYGEDDSVDTNFISEEEWMESHQSSDSEPIDNNVKYTNGVPYIKKPIMPSWNEKKRRPVNVNKYVGRVTVPDVFSNQNGKAPIRRSNGTGRTNNHELLLAADDERTKIKLLTSDVPFNSFDINASMQKKKNVDNIRPVAKQPVIIRKR